MEELHLLLGLSVIAFTALIGGLLAQRLRQTVLLGYLIGGILVGPHGLGLVQGGGELQTLATIGVAFLMFALGVEISVRALFERGLTPFMLGAVQVTAVTSAWALVAGWLGWPLIEGVLFGYFIALSSTAIVLKLLTDRGEIDTLHGKILVGILVFQDITVVPVMVVISSMPANIAAAPVTEMAAIGALALVKAAAVAGGMLFLGLRVVPYLLHHVALLRSRELFIIAVFALVIGTAAASVLFGLSLALGAFVAGMLVSESEYSHQALADVIPLRDIFASFFFVSIGMLTDMNFIFGNIGLLGMILMVLFAAKCLLPALALALLRYPARPSLSTGAGILPIGEFSFVLAGSAVALGLVSERILSLTLATALLSMLLAPAAFAAADGAYKLLARHRVQWLRGDLQGGDSDAITETRHAIICGFGRTGRMLANMLDRREFPFVIVDIDPLAIEYAKERNVPCVYGDVSSLSVLQRCGLQQARVLVLAISDPLATDIAVQNARAINPRLDVVARVARQNRGLFHLTTENIEVVEPGFEASLEILRHTLHRFGVSSQETQLLVSSLRRSEAVG